jgi:NAD(P)-dependent dehydrogenase (short-subunit alcohol dehydrogenase family)
MAFDPETELLHKPPNLRLDGKVVWVTGASQGVGKALAFALAGAGAELLLTARNTAALKDIAATIRKAGGVAQVVPGSVAEPSDVATAVDTASRVWGRLDVLVNNAGVGANYEPVERLDDGEWARVLGVNLTGPFICSRAALPLMERSDSASVVNVSSIHGHVGGDRLASYAASKGGLELLTRSLALEWASKDIRVNSLAPGYLKTEMTAGLREHDKLSALLLTRIPLRRFGEPREVVAAALFLASPASSYVTGTTLVVDGGWTAA